MNSSERSTGEGAGGKPVLDRAALSALLREVLATHLFVWKTNAGGVLVSEKIPLEEIPAQIRMAGRVAEGNLDEAMNMLQSASRQFDGAVQRWDAQARKSEDSLRADRSGKKLNNAKARHNATRSRIIPLQSVFRRAAASLNEANRVQRQRNDDANPGSE